MYTYGQHYCGCANHVNARLQLGRQNPSTSIAMNASSGDPRAPGAAHNGVELEDEFEDAYGAHGSVGANFDTHMEDPDEQSSIGSHAASHGIELYAQLLTQTDQLYPCRVTVVAKGIRTLSKCKLPTWKY